MVTVLHGQVNHGTQRSGEHNPSRRLDDISIIVPLTPFLAAPSTASSAVVPGARRNRFLRGVDVLDGGGGLVDFDFGRVRDVVDIRVGRGGGIFGWDGVECLLVGCWSCFWSRR